MTAASNNSMDVRQKQRLFYRGSSETFACVQPVFAHVISAVVRFSVNRRSARRANEN
jgi:hypothetical protein